MQLVLFLIDDSLEEEVKRRAKDFIAVLHQQWDSLVRIAKEEAIELLKRALEVLFPVLMHAAKLAALAAACATAFREVMQALHALRELGRICHDGLNPDNLVPALRVRFFSSLGTNSPLPQGVVLQQVQSFHSALDAALAPFVSGQSLQPPSVDCPQVCWRS